jgi:aminoglycoside phosphotransferase (APT) family kinase protein
MTELFEQEILTVVRLHGEAFGVAKQDVCRLAFLGEGENHRNVLLRTDRHRVVFRISLRQPEGASDPFYEFQGLRLLPPDLGPVPLWFDGSRGVLPHPFSVLSYVEGEPRLQWSNGDLRRHARQLARLHATRFDKAGPVGANEGRYDPCAFHRAIPESYGPLLADDLELAALFSEVGHYLAERAGLFARLNHYSLVHFDLYAGNVLFDRQGQARFIDWEWMQIADNAEDLARFYHHGFGFPPWYIKMSRDSLVRFMDEYRRSLGGDDTLEQRVEALHVYYTFADLIYFRNAAVEAAASDRNLRRYQEVSHALKTTLKEALQ